ncbi:hypothetical protein BL253_15045 [Pseudofrankia asymbiotica]|uniref:Uncharacterized protein n=1 Tax=Pseudofrankia asymbiotica TaxID=1834516 RepID=A0A1V2IB45_9ACTN|nr:hypothetical protein BL253_15045 [Pseudofrankia asymbiotica]
MMSEAQSLYAVIQYDGAGRQDVRQVVAPFPDRGAAATFAVDNEMRHFTVRPMVLAAPPGPPSIPAPRRPT